MITVAEAIRIVKQQTRKRAAERVALPEALGRFLAEDIVADSDLPPFDRSQMDGYAVRAADVQKTPVRLRIVGESAAGAGWHNRMNVAEAVRIMTGAPVPAGADSVQQVELTREPESGIVEILEPVKLGRSIVERGSEITAGKTVLKSGERITAAKMAVLASFGYAGPNVGARPRVSVLATGSELVSVDQKPGQDQIRDSNNYSITAYAELAGAVVDRLPSTGDQTEALRERISDAAGRSDLVITSGGVSMGVYDFTKTALKDLGAEVFFERVALRPGKPTVFARLPAGTLFFGLPGNPVSVSVTFNLFARVALLAMQGAAELDLEEQSAVLMKDIKGANERESYLPVRLNSDKNGRLMAEPLKWGGSSDFVAFAQATALVIIPRDTKLIEANQVVRIVRLPG